MAEYLANAIQGVDLNGTIIFDASIPCNRGNVFHEDGTGIFILRGITQACFARYQVTFNGNAAIPTGGTVAPIAIAIAVNGETRQTSRAILTPAAVDQYGNLTSTAIITVPKGCCFSVSIRNVPAGDTTTPSINIQNANLVITRIA